MSKSFSVLYVLVAFFLVLLGVGVAAQPAAGQELSMFFPPGFRQEVVVSGLKLPTAFAFAPGNRIYIAQKDGMVRVARNGELLPAPFVDLSGEVNTSADRGLMGIAVHPRFSANPLVYVAYVYDPPEVKSYQASGARLSRVLRLKTNPKAPDVAIAGSGVVVLGAGGDFAAIGNPDKGDAKPYSCRAADGTPLRDCVPEEGTAHQINSLVFGLDGALYVASGDGINYGEGSLRAQELDNLSGKILRINPLTGDGYANNPFFDGDLKSNRSKIFAYGMRNPFRLAVQPRTGAIYSAEVGNNQFEEVNLVVRGANLGWPCFEGAKANAFDPICQPLLDGQTAVTHALYAYPHENGRGAVIGGAFYTNKLYPADYAGLYFFADFNVGVIHTLAVEKSGAVTMKDFASGAWGIVQISLGPDGVLYWLSVQTGSLYRIVYEKK